MRLGARLFVLSFRSVPPVSFPPESSILLPSCLCKATAFIIVLCTEHSNAERVGGCVYRQWWIDPSTQLQSSTAVPSWMTATSCRMAETISEGALSVCNSSCCGGRRLLMIIGKHTSTGTHRALMSACYLLNASLREHIDCDGNRPGPVLRSMEKRLRRVTDLETLI